MHGNHKKSPKKQVLYAIYFGFSQLYKYGISGKNTSDGQLPKRARDQVDSLNDGLKLTSEKRRFWASVILYNIPGRRIALILEALYNRWYFMKNGKYPPGEKLSKRRKGRGKG